MEIKVLGGCCMKSAQNLYNIENAIQELGLNIKVIEISDMNEITSYGATTTPGLVIDGNLVSSGSLLSIEEAKQIISRFL